MKSKKLNTSLEYDMNKFKYLFLVALSKLNTPDTCKQAQDEIRALLSAYYVDNDLLNFIFNCVTETNEHQKITTKREYIKLICLIAETLGEKLADNLNRVFQLLNKKLHESEPHLNQVISDTYGVIMEKVIRKLPKNTGFKYTKQILNGLYTNLNEHNKNLQIATSMCLIKMIQNCPLEYLISFNEELTKNILDYLRAPHFKSQTHLLEALLSLILSVEKEFKNNVNDVVDYILEIFSRQNNLEWTVKKISIDLIYTLAIILKETIIPYKEQLLSILQERKCDKIKYVREAALIAINILRNIDGPQKDDDFTASRLSNPPKTDEKYSFHTKNYEMNPPIKEIFERYKNLSLPQNNMSVGKPQTQNIYQKYLSDQKLPEDLKTNSYMNSPVNQYNYDNKYGSGYNKANSTNGNINLQKSNILGNDLGDEGGRNSSKDIVQQDMDYLFNKMEIFMIQQNKIQQNFINFESEIRGEMQFLKEKVTKLENALYVPAENNYNKDKKMNNKTMKNDENERLSAYERPTEMRAYSTEKYKPRTENPYQNLKKENPDPYSLINNPVIGGTTSDIKRSLNKFKETNDYIQQKYDFSDLGKKGDDESIEKIKIDHFLSKNEFNEAMNLTFSLKDIWSPLELLLEKKIDFKNLKNECLVKISERMMQIMEKKENLNLFCVWLENCCKFDTLKNNLMIIRTTNMLKEYVSLNENNPNLEESLMSNLKKMVKMIETNGEI